MTSVFILTPDGQRIAGPHIGSLDVQGSGTDDQLRFEVQATLVTGERQALWTFRGAGAHSQAEGFITDLLAQLGTQVYNPREGVGAGREPGGHLRLHGRRRGGAGSSCCS